MLYHLSVLPDSDDLSSKSPTCELFKGANVCSHVQSRQLVHVSGIYCRVPGPSAGDCAFVDCTALYGVQ